MHHNAPCHRWHRWHRCHALAAALRCWAYIPDPRTQIARLRSHSSVEVEHARFDRTRVGLPRRLLPHERTAEPAAPSARLGRKARLRGRALAVVGREALGERVMICEIERVTPGGDARRRAVRLALIQMSHVQQRAHIEYRRPGELHMAGGSSTLGCMHCARPGRTEGGSE